MGRGKIIFDFFNSGPSSFQKEFLTTQIFEFETGLSGWNVMIYERQSVRLSNPAPFLIWNTMNLWYIDKFVFSQLHLFVPQVDLIAVTILFQNTLALSNGKILVNIENLQILSVNVCIYITLIWVGRCWYPCVMTLAGIVEYK